MMGGTLVPGTGLVFPWRGVGVGWGMAGMPTASAWRPGGAGVSLGPGGGPLVRWPGVLGPFVCGAWVVGSRVVPVGHHLWRSRSNSGPQRRMASHCPNYGLNSNPCLGGTFWRRKGYGSKPRQKIEALHGRQKKER